MPRFVNGQFVKKGFDALRRAPLELGSAMSETAQNAGYMLESNFQRQRAKDAEMKMANLDTDHGVVKKAKEKRMAAIKDMAFSAATMTGGLKDVSAMPGMRAGVHAKTAGGPDLTPQKIVKDLKSFYTDMSSYGGENALADHIDGLGMNAKIGKEVSKMLEKENFSWLSALVWGLTGK